jgi:hypothetical protein
MQQLQQVIRCCLLLLLLLLLVFRDTHSPCCSSCSSSLPLVPKQTQQHIPLRQWLLLLLAPVFLRCRRLLQQLQQQIALLFSRCDPLRLPYLLLLLIAVMMTCTATTLDLPRRSSTSSSSTYSSLPHPNKSPR